MTLSISGDSSYDGFLRPYRNWMLNFGLVFETVLAAAISYTPYLDTALNTYPLR